MDNFSQTIKNLLKFIKNLLKTKPDLNEENIFRQNNRFDKSIFVKQDGQYVNILSLINGLELQKHIHKNQRSLDLISDKVDNNDIIFAYNGILYQKKFPYDIDSELLSKFKVEGNILYFNDIKVIDPDTRPQKSYNKFESISNSTVEINFNSISTENQIQAITNSELIITNKNSESVLDIIISNNDINVNSKISVAPNESHVYMTGINKGTIITMTGNFEYSITLNYF